MNKFVDVFRDKFLNGAKTHRKQIESLVSIVFEESDFSSKISDMMDELDRKENLDEQEVDNDVRQDRDYPSRSVIC